MSEFDLFRMCFPDNYIWEVVVPTTNRYIDGPNMTLQDFYVWLGCHFFMACFEGIEKKNVVVGEDYKHVRGIALQVVRVHVGAEVPEYWSSYTVH